MWDGNSRPDEWIGSDGETSSSPDREGAVDDGLLVRIADGCKDSFRTLMRRHARPMLALAGRMTGSADDADEIVQDVFLKVWTLAPRWRVGGEARFSSWLYRVVVNACVDRRRRRSEQPLDGIEERPDSAPDALQRTLVNQRRDMLQGAVAALPRRQRAALSLFYFAELSAPETARVMRISVPATEALLMRGKRSLKKALMENGVTGVGDFL